MRDLDQAVVHFHQVRLADDWRYLFLDQVSLRLRRHDGLKQVQLLVAYGVRVDGSRQLLAFRRSTSESQAVWEGLLHDLYRRGPEGRHFQLIVTDGGPGPGWRRRYRPFLNVRPISAVGCTSSVIC